jgi:hypothetical protein
MTEELCGEHQIITIMTILQQRSPDRPLLVLACWLLSFSTYPNELCWGPTRAPKAAREFLL